MNDNSIRVSTVGLIFKCRCILYKSVSTYLSTNIQILRFILPNALGKKTLVWRRCVDVCRGEQNRAYFGGRASRDPQVSGSVSYSTEVERTWKSSRETEVFQKQSV